VKAKHLKQRVESCFALAALSTCSRRKIGCVILDPQSNVVISDSYNGTLRGGGDLCGTHRCLREGIESGTRLEVGCVHAEQNAIYNASRKGVSLLGAWLFVNAEPCAICAKAIVQVGISRVICIVGGYSVQEGVDLLEEAGVKVHTIPKDATEADYEGILSVANGVRLPRFTEVITRSPFQNRNGD